MVDPTRSLVPTDSLPAVPPPRRGRRGQYLGLHALQVVTRLGLLPLATSVVALAALSRCHRRLPAR